MSDQPKSKPCPHDYNEQWKRRYFVLAGGRIELQTKGLGSTARIMIDGYQHPLTCLIDDDYMEMVAAKLNKVIEEYALTNKEKN